ncbi:Na/Pi cotransporter family protein [Gemella sp. GH3]|uniref:Na/Pi cotransporter family protein n=1 Tax=unclassified Gemella TaxID=2624949 RepID=UPI0015D036E0|nr:MULTISPECIES: Na/Pi cotransporter family protein [unclassified Gemella]MBF0713531.1 Na/Pi cotransporter family protein [Gemella sp. GH3.1]NYS50483.1 Na/Pi cotransporter family protein [Gemella sp. GH3]
MSEIWQNILFTFFGGLGLFLFSIKYMGDGLQLIAGDKMRNVLDRYTSTPLRAVLVGIFVTVLIQSSSGSTVITVSLVAAGLLNLKQAIGIVMGANIGTTVTSFIIGFNLSAYALPVIFIGAACLFFTKRKNVNNIGRVLFGVGGIFYSLKLMSSAMGPMKEMDWFMAALGHLSDSPIVGVTVGTVLTMLIQSSAATIAILQNLYADGAVDLSAALPVLFGDNIGTTITAVLAVLGSTIAARRVAAAHVLFNVIGTIICLIALYPYTMFIQYIENSLGLDPKMTIAFAHGTFNVLNTLLQFPFIWLLAVIVTKIIPGEDEVIKYRTQHLETSLITSAPAIALGQVKKEFISMLELSQKSVNNAVNYFLTKEEKLFNKGITIEEAINSIDEEMTNYLSLLFREKLSEKEGIEASGLLDGTRDIERIGDHSRDIITSIKYQIDKGIKFSDDAVKEVKEMHEQSVKMIDLTIKSLEEDDNVIAGEALAICNKMYALEKNARKNHTNRMREGSCGISGGVVYIDLITHFTRICEHVRNILEKKLTGTI